MSGKENLLSFLCISYNHERYIKDCIESIWNNDYKNIEIIALDDGSKDNSLSILNELKEKSPCPMTVIAQENTGCIGANLNKLIKLSNGEYFSMMSCDDMVVENTVKVKMDEFDKNPNLAFICHSKILGINENNQRINSVPPMKLDEIENPKIEDLLLLERDETGSHYTQGGIYKKSVALEFGCFDDDMICDDIIFRTKLCRYMLQHPDLEFKVLKTPAIYYRRHGENISSNSLRQLKGLFEYYSRYWADEAPPANFIHYFEMVGMSRKEFTELFITDAYKQKVFSSISQKDLKRFLIDEEYLYKKQGLPFIFEILSYKRDNKKIKVVKLFNIKVHEYIKRIK